MKKADLSSQEMDDLFKSVQSHVEVPSDAFLTQLEAQAAAGFASPVKNRGRVAVRWSELKDLLGGWGGLGGLAVATMAGVWIGVSPPDVLLDQTDMLDTTWNLGLQGFDIGFGLDATDWVMSEGG